MNHEKGTGIVLKDTYQSLFKAPIRTVQRPKLKKDSITALSDIFDSICFNADTCAIEVDEHPEKNLIKSMAYYRYKWDEDTKVYSKEPMGDWAADPADMMQTLALEYSWGTISGERLGFTKAIPKESGDYDPYRHNVLEFARNNV